ncbi:MAG: alpha/beta fold hydrolase [Pirellulaceae bacterium]
MNILFLHGWQSTPGGLKPSFLKDHGHDVLNPALPDDDFDAAVAVAQAEFDQGHPDVVVGSSRGGAVAMNINSGETPLVLLCPAWKRWGMANSVKPSTTILHSRADEVVPFVDSEELVRNSGLPETALVVIGTEHRLADPESLKEMLKAVDEAGVKAGRLAGDVLQHEAGVPHRFGVGTLLVISTMYAVLFALWRFGGGSPKALVWVTLFFTAVGLGQMLMFKGRQPRKASVIVGAYVYPCMFIGDVLYNQLAAGVVDIVYDRIFFELFFCVPVGGVYGYLAGLLIAAQFLVVDKLRSIRVRSNDIDQTDGART